MNKYFDITALKPPPEGMAVNYLKEGIEIVAIKKDYDFLVFQIFLLLFPLGLLCLIVGFSFDLLTILYYIVFLALSAWWIASNLLAKFRIILANDKIQIYEGIEQGRLIYSFDPKLIEDVKVGSERSVNVGSWKGRSTLYLYDLMFHLKNGKSFVVGKTLMNDHKYYIHYFFTHYIEEGI